MFSRQNPGNLNPDVALAITLQLTPCGDSKRPLCVEGELYALPKGLVSGLQRLAKFTGNRHVSGAFSEYVHLREDRINATDNVIAIEMRFESAQMPEISLSPFQIKLIASFGLDPSSAVVSEKELLFEFPDGQNCKIYRCPDYPDKFASVFDRHWKVEASASNLEWRDDFLHHFEGADADDRLWVYPDRFVSGKDGRGGSQIILAVRTGSKEESLFDTRVLLPIARMADRIDFSQKHCCFTLPDGRGMVAGRSR